MSEQLRESLSALLDDEANELEVERILANTRDDESLRQAWVRYNLVRGVVKGDGMAFSQLDVSQRVRASIDDDDGASSGQGGLRARLLKPVASFAVAASVAATVVIGGQQLAQVEQQGGYSSGDTVASNASPVGMLGALGAIPVQASYGTQSIPVLQPATRTAYQQLARQRMQRYMQEHAEHAALNSPQGLIPFARVQEIQE